MGDGKGRCVRTDASCLFHVEQEEGESEVFHVKRGGARCFSALYLTNTYLRVRDTPWHAAFSV